jgi:cation/acetate symporter
MKRILIFLTLTMALLVTSGVLEPAAYAGPESIISQAMVGQAAPAPAPAKVKADWWTTVIMFLVIISITLCVVVWAAKRTQTIADFYAARGAITGTQNGWAIAGDYMSAASFLGVSGLISLFGYDGFMYAVGAVVAYVTVLLIVAEPCRNAGKYTVGDIVSFRSSPKIVRAMIACSTLLLSTLYLIVQMVGAGKLMNLLLDIPYNWAIVGVGVMMVVYVVFGGMVATTWVQIIKAGLLMAGALVLAFLVGVKVGFNPLNLFQQVAESQHIRDWVQFAMLKQPVAVAGFDYGQRFLEPGLLLKNFWEQLSLCMAFVLGTAGMPHILMRFFTVPTAQAARKSVIIAMFIIGFFFILTTFLGFGSALFVTPQKIFAVDKGGNMANMLLALTLGGEISPFFGDLLLAFLCAVAFATILAVVSGLVLASSAAISHDIYVSIIKGGKAGQREQITAARITAFCVGAISIVIGMLAENQNVAHLAVLAFAVASSGNLPAVVLSLFWRKMSTGGICGGLIVGSLVAIGLVLVSPNMTYPKAVAAQAKTEVTTLEKKQADGQALNEKEQGALKKAQATYESNKDGTSLLGLDKPWFKYKNPGLFSIPIGFFAAWLFSILFPSKREQDAFDELYVRQNTGLGIAKAVDH